MNFKFGLIVIVMTSVILSCSSVEEKKVRTAEDLFNDAMELFNDEEYRDAKLKFEAIGLQYPASKFASEAQFYVAECHYNREEYFLAAYNYNRLRRYYSTSPRYKVSLFKSGMSYYNVAPAYDRDPEYTYKAIQTLTEFQSVYSDDSLATVAGEYIVELRNRLAEREYFNATLYRNLRSPYSALIYYDEVIEKFYDTKYYEDAYLGKIEVLIEMEKYNQAVTAIDLYYSIFPTGKNMEDVKSLEKSIPSDFRQ